VKILGTDDAVNACDCCGKTRLKSTVAIETGSGEVVHYGVVCAARAMKADAKAVKAAARAADDAAVVAKMAAEDARHREYMRRWTAHLVARTGGIMDWAGKPDVFRMIQALGGMAKARQGFDG
jgi:hypothetical protein